MIKEVILNNGEHWINIGRFEYTIQIALLCSIIVLLYIAAGAVAYSQDKKFNKYLREHKHVDEYIKWKQKQRYEEK